ncbi:MAG: hypothetical protein R3E96_05125 [Planctomycetota bacterium]
MGRRCHRKTWSTWLGRVGDDVWQGNQVTHRLVPARVARPSRYGLDWLRRRVQLPDAAHRWRMDAVTEIRAGAETVELGYGPH